MIFKIHYSCVKPIYVKAGKEVGTSGLVICRIVVLLNNRFSKRPK